MILIIGATGPTGKEAVAQLVNRGQKVRAVTRDPEKAAAMAELAGAEIVAGDSSNVASLTSAFEGVDKVYLVPPTDRNWDQLQSAIVEAARAAGVAHIVKMSAIGAGPDQPSMSLSFHWQGEVDIEDAGIAYTFIRPNSFFQNTLFDAPTINAEGKFYSCVGDAQFAKIDTRDIGEVVAKVLSEDGHQGKIYELTGPEPLTYSDIAVTLSSAVGRSIEYVDMAADDYAGALETAGFPGWLAKEFADIYGRGFYRDSGGAYTTDTVERLLGRPPRAFSEFARDYAEAFG
jgi:uncharacterized protein YbjT (DUF2867 family)